MVFIPADKLSDFELLLDDRRVENIFYRLVDRAVQSGREVPEELEFATYIQPESDKSSRPQAVFIIQSDHPKQRFVGQKLRTLGAVPLDQWRRAEKEKLHYAGVPDPANNIFARLLREHLDTRKNLKELID